VPDSIAEVVVNAKVVVSGVRVITGAAA